MSDPKIRENFEVLIGERRGDINNVKIKGKLKKIRIKGKWMDYLEMEKATFKRLASSKMDIFLPFKFNGLDLRGF